MRDFFTALAARDAGAARALVFPPTVYGSDATLLTNSTLRNPGYTPPVNPRATRLPPPKTYAFRKGEEGAAVQADFKLAGVAMQEQVILARGGSYGNRWVILNPLRPMLVTGPTGGGLLIFAGTPYPRSAREFVAFPGAYRVTLAKHPLIEADPVTALARGAPTVEVVARVRADVRREINRQIRTHLNACIVNHAPCPLTIRWTPPFELYGDQASRITRYPTVIVEPSPAMDYPLVFRNETPGEIQVSVRTSPTAVSVSRRETFTVSGRVVLEGGAIVVKRES